ncbi:CHAP domain-containing protein [Streptomyces sp. NPDC045456]|uniref:aggregation-promoting factor C-terminal-like domain-containing protein n=1 Tax=Streptomyces sp. NPDC045456 TaxID=3155254 RepID=UPI0033D215F2
MASEDQGVPVARAKVPVTPHLDQASARRMQEETARAVGRAADESGRAFERGFVPKVIAALEEMVSSSTRSGKRSEAALKAAATRAAQAQARALEWVSEKEGETTAALVRLAFKAADEKHKALLGLSARHKRVLSTMGLEEESAVKAMVKASQLGEVRKQEAFKETGAAYKAELKQRNTALRASLNEGLRDYKLVKTQEIEAERSATLAYKAELTERLSTLRAELAAATQAQEAASARQATLMAAAGARWRKSSQQIEHLGTQSAELAGLLSRNVITPLAVAGGMATKFGVQATDSFDKAANSLGGLGVSIQGTMRLLNHLQKFAIDSSFSLEDMNEFAPQYVRILTSHGTAPDVAAKQSESLIKAIANNAAHGGITDPEKLARAMQQVAYILDTDKLTLRNLKPFENATNMSMEQIATMLGYKDKKGPNVVRDPHQHWTRKYVTQTDKTHYSKDAKGKWVVDERGAYIKNSRGGYTKDGGHYEWVKDNDGRYIQQGFKNGKPNYVLDKGKKGKEQTASAQLMADMTASSAPSGKTFIDKLIQSGDKVDTAAKRAQNATIRGRLQGMKESAQRDLMGLFAQRDKNGDFIVRRDPKTGMLTHVQTDLYKNLLKTLDGVKELWQVAFPGLKVASKAFVDGLNKVISIATNVAEFVEDHPALQGFLKTLVSFSVKALPLLIAFGLASKILGKSMKLIGGAGQSAKSFGKAIGRAGKGVGKGALTVGRGIKHLEYGRRGRRDDGSFLSGYRASRARSRDAMENGWQWTNRARLGRDRARSRFGHSKVETLRGYGRAGTQWATGGLIDFTDRDRRASARRRYRDERKRLRGRINGTPQTADNAFDLLQLARQQRENKRQWKQDRKTGRRRDYEAYRSARDSRPYVLDNRHEEEYNQRRRDRRARNRRTASDHLPAVPMPRTEHLKLETQSAEQAIKRVDERLKALAEEMKRVNSVRLEHIRGEFDGSTASVSHSAVKAREAIEHIKSLGVQALNNADLSQAQGRLAGVEGSSVEHSAKKAEDAVRKIKAQGMEPLNSTSLGRAQNELSGEVSSVKAAADQAARKVGSVRSALTDLNNSASTGRVQAQFTGVEGSLKASVQDSKAAVTRLATAIRNLKDISFETIKRKFNGAGSLKTSVNDVKNAVGVPSGKTGLNPALNKINGVSFRSAESKLNNLKTKIDAVAKAAGALDTAVRKVNSDTGSDGGAGSKRGNGGSKSGGGSHRSKPSSFAPSMARGYVETGVHASFGGGAIGPAAGGASGPGGLAAAPMAAPMSFMAAPAAFGAGARAGGGGSGRLSGLLGGFDELQKILDLSGLFSTARASIGIGKASAGLGKMGSGIENWAASKAGWAGRQYRSVPDRLADWYATKLPDLLVKQTEGTPWTQLAGLGMGLVAPTVSSAFMSEVYHGHGNIIGRSGRMVDEIFSLDTIGEVFSNLIDMVKGVATGVKELLSLAGQFITDPMGVLGDLKDWAVNLFTSSMDGWRNTWDDYMSILQDPSAFAAEVARQMMDGLRDALPNLDGLWDFSTGYADGGVVPGYAPGRDRVRAMLSPGEGVLRPEVVRVIGAGRVEALNEAARSGNFKALAEQVEGLWQTVIQPTWVAMTQEVKTDLSPTTERYRDLSVSSWATIGRAVQTAWQSAVSPSMTAWSTRIRGDLTPAEQTFLSAHLLVWSQAASSVDRSKASSLASFGALRQGVTGLRDHMQSAGAAIESSWRSSMSYVDSSTRSTITGPYNAGVVSMTAAMAGLAGASAPLKPLHFALGGVVDGYAPGRDVVPAVLSPGEGVLRPEVVRALGANTIHEWNRQARQGGNMFANGGIVKPIGWKSETGAQWVNAHKDDPYSGYREALQNGWTQNVEAMTAAVRKAFSSMGGVNAGVVDHFKGSVLEWGKYLDDHVGGASAAVKQAQQELGYTEIGPNRVKYNQFNGEEWCADFVSWVVDKAGANSSYWNSPTGTPEHRWPSVATWNSEAAGSLISASQARPGDIVTYRNGGHIGMVESLANGVLHTIEGNVGPTVRRLNRSLGDPDHVFRARGSGVPGASFSGWPGAYASGVEIPIAGGLEGGTPARNRAVAKQLLDQMGWGDQWGALDAMWTRESGWNHLARNPSSGAYGIVQALPPGKMASAGADWLTNPTTQIRWGLGYIKDRYGDPARAWEFWKRNHWYAKGTRSASPGLALVGERGPELVEMRGGERVHTASETAALLGRRPITVNIHAAPDVPTEETVLRALERAHIMHGL